MADPVTTTLAVVSTALKVGGELSSANSEAKQYGYEAGVAGQNAQISRENAATLRLNAKQALNEGQAAEEAARRALRKSIGRSSAAISQAGIGAPGTGSAGALLRQAGIEGELDALNIRYGAQTEAQAIETDARSQDQEAAQYDQERLNLLSRQKSAKRSGLVRAGAAALEGFANYRSASSAASTARQMAKVRNTPVPTAPVRITRTKAKAL